MVGYGGRWFQKGKSELIRGEWEPSKLKVGDIVTAVLAGPPANLMRILVNGEVVAQKTASTIDLPAPGSEGLWGIVDVENACVKVRLGHNNIKLAATKFEAQIPSTDAWASKEASIEAKLLARGVTLS